MQLNYILSRLIAFSLAFLLLLFKKKGQVSSPGTPLQLVNDSPRIMTRCFSLFFRGVYFLHSNNTMMKWYLLFKKKKLYASI